MVYTIKAFPDIERVIHPFEKKEMEFPIFQKSDLLKIFQREKLVEEQTRQKSLERIRPGTYLQTSKKHPIIPQSFKGLPLSAANACIQMVAFNHILPEYSAKLSSLATQVNAALPPSDEATLHAIEGHIENSLKKMHLEVIINKIPVAGMQDKRLPFLGQLIQANGPCIVTVVNHAEKQFKGHTTPHFVMVDWIAEYSVEGKPILAAEIRDPSCEGYYLVYAAVLQKACLIGSKVFQVTSQLGSPNSPHYEDRFPKTPMTERFFNRRPPSLLVDSPVTSSASSTPSTAQSPLDPIPE